MQANALPVPTLNTFADRPRGLVLVVGVELLVGVLSIAGAVGSLAANLPPPTGLGFLEPLAPVFPWVMLAIGAFFDVTGVGLWRGLAWAWTGSIVFEVVHILADIGFVASRSFALDKFVGLVVILAILYYLTQPGVRAYFGKQS